MGLFQFVIKVMGRELIDDYLRPLLTESVLGIFGDAGPSLFNAFEISRDAIKQYVIGFPFRPSFPMEELNVVPLVGKVYAHATFLLELFIFIGMLG